MLLRIIWVDGGKWEEGRGKMEAGRGKREVGSSKLEDGSGKKEVGSRKHEDGRWKKEAGSGKARNSRLSGRFVADHLSSRQKSRLIKIIFELNWNLLYMGCPAGFSVLECFVN
ncbi:MAG: hypothetical protein NXH89_19640, partial [Cyclobacteriaceae bacterium]|nr:hypothetical protein [Cyclobacteriaceae bacterium]